MNLDYRSRRNYHG